MVILAFCLIVDFLEIFKLFGENNEIVILAIFMTAEFVMLAVNSALFLLLGIHAEVEPRPKMNLEKIENDQKPVNTRQAEQLEEVVTRTTKAHIEATGYVAYMKPQKVKKYRKRAHVEPEVSESDIDNDGYYGTFEDSVATSSGSEDEIHED